MRSLPRILTAAPTWPEVVCFYKRAKTHGHAEDLTPGVASHAGADGGPSHIRCPVEVPIGSLDQRCVGVFAVRAPTLGAEAVERGQFANRGDFEDRATTPIFAGPAIICC